MIHLYLSTISKGEIIEEFLVGYFVCCFFFLIPEKEKEAKRKSRLGGGWGLPNMGKSNP